MTISKDMNFTGDGTPNGKKVGEQVYLMEERVEFAGQHRFRLREQAGFSQLEVMK